MTHYLKTLANTDLINFRITVNILYVLLRFDCQGQALALMDGHLGLINFHDLCTEGLYALRKGTYVPSLNFRYASFSF